MQYKLIKFGPEGYPLYYYCEVTYPPAINIDEETGVFISKTANANIPPDAVSVTETQWLDAQNMQLWLSPTGELTVPPELEPIEPEPIIAVLPSVTLWERMTDDEAEQVRAAMETQPFRVRQIFLTANTFRSDHELWPLLETMATQLFGDARAAELLAP